MTNIETLVAKDKHDMKWNVEPCSSLVQSLYVFYAIVPEKSWEILLFFVKFWFLEKTVKEVKKKNFQNNN